MQHWSMSGTPTTWRWWVGRDEVDAWNRQQKVRYDESADDLCRFVVPWFSDGADRGKEKTGAAQAHQGNAYATAGAFFVVIGDAHTGNIAQGESPPAIGRKNFQLVRFDARREGRFDASDVRTILKANVFGRTLHPPTLAIDGVEARYPGFFDDLSALLFRHDPIRINFGTNTDEYEPEVGTILPRLEDCSSAVDMQRVVYEEFVRWFGADIAGPRERYAEIAADTWELWQQFRVNRV